MTHQRYVIRAEHERDDDGSPLYWNNGLGWTVRCHASRFASMNYKLPIGGVWEGIGPACGHSACRQNWIDTEQTQCVEHETRIP